jgi:hypothetical protein
VEEKYQRLSVVKPSVLVKRALLDGIKDGIDREQGR